VIAADHLRDAQTVWDHHLLHHPRVAADVGIVLGCCDIQVPRYAADLYHQGLVPLLLFTGATSSTTIDVFPEGEAVAFRI